jgi:hypothetical protein
MGSDRHRTFWLKRSSTATSHHRLFALHAHHSAGSPVKIIERNSEENVNAIDLMEPDAGSPH